MLGKALFLVLVVGVLMGIAMWLESRRERELRAWTEAMPGRQLHWPFIPAQHPNVPAVELVQRMIQRPPIGWASALRTTDAAGEVWWIEFRTTPPGKKSSQWFTLVARRTRDGLNSGPEGVPATNGSPGAPLADPWVCHCREGVIRVAGLGEALEPPRASPLGP